LSDLSPDLTLAISTDRESTTITDETVFGTGGNPARADVRVYLKGYKMVLTASTNSSLTTSYTALTTTGDTDDPATDASWLVTYTEDGSYKYNYVIVEEEYDVATTYARYDAVYSGDVVYRSKTNSNVGQSLSNTTYWEVIESPADLAANKGTSTESTNVTSTVYLRVLAADGQYYYANYISDQCACVDCDEQQFFTKATGWMLLLDRIAIADSRSEIVDGESAALRMMSNYFPD
jgi:hypothetical protein